MLATIVEATEVVTRKGTPALRLEVRDDYEQRYFMFFAPEAWAYFTNMLKLTHTPLISKDGGKTWGVPMRHWKDKVLSVERETVELGNRRFEIVRIARRYWYEVQEWA